MSGSLATVDRWTRFADKWGPPATKRRGCTEPASLAGFVPYLSPRWREPKHLAPLTEALDSIIAGRERHLVVDTPPRHGKTETLLHFIALALRRRPEWPLGYAGYASQLTRSKSRRARQLSRDAGVALADDMANLEEWRTKAGGGLLATGVGGPLTGHGLQVLLVDDPIKNRVEAESKTHRNRIWDWFNDVAYTRIEPGGSAVIVHTRWHEDDLAGRLLKQGWERIHLPALSDDGASLWPERWSAERLAQIRAQIGEYAWASLYQGEPRPRGGAVFGDVHLYAEPPTSGYRVAVGVDFAYTAKKRSDYSVAVVMAAEGERRFILDVKRAQVPAPEFMATLRQLKVSHPGASFRAYIGGTERGTVDFFARDGVDIEAIPATADKFVRAQPYAAGWNAGRVLVREGAEWAPDFVSEHADFTGADDAHDDQVDAAAAAYDALEDADFSWFEALARA